LSLLERDERGRVFEEELLCPRCSTVRDYVDALRKVAKWTRDVAELRSLLEQLLQFMSVPAEERHLDEGKRGALTMKDEYPFDYPLVPFINAVDDAVDYIFGVLNTWARVDKGAEYVGQLVDERAEANSKAAKIGWRLLKWGSREEKTVYDALLRVVEEHEKTRYVALAYSENTDTYYVFAYPSKRIYHFTKTDIAYFALTQLEEYVRTIIVEEQALMEGRWNERGFFVVKEETIVYDGLRALGGIIEWEGRIRMRYLWRNAAYNCIYVLADFAGRYRAWRRLELSSSLCLDCFDGDKEECREECENALVRQFFEP
jgi:hypothetical protein